MRVAPVSCIITSYNNRAILSKAVNSVLNQTLPVAEIIIADDCSSDGSHELIKTLAHRHSCITPILRERNLGVAANRDLAIKSAAQPFVTHLDGDDLFAVNKIQAEWAVLERRPYAIAYSRIAKVNTSAFFKSSVVDPSITLHKNELALVNILTRSGPIPRDMMLSKELFCKVGGFTHGIAMYEDWQFKLKLALSGAEWLDSNSLGTLYMQWPGTLSRASKEKHLQWKLKILQPLIPDLSEKIGRMNLYNALLKQFNLEDVHQLVNRIEPDAEPVQRTQRSIMQAGINWCQFMLRLPEIRKSLQVANKEIVR